MQQRYCQFNLKRRLIEPKNVDPQQLQSLVKLIGYGGNPEHKKNPGDFGLHPPTGPRLGKSLCDDVAIVKRSEALRLLKLGLMRKMISDRFENGWPKNIWAVTDDGKPLEAQLENSSSGSYHGYPMPESDPFAQQIMKRWEHV